MSGLLLKSDDIYTSEFESFGSNVKVEIVNFDERPESSLGEIKEDDNQFKDRGDEEFIRDPAQIQTPRIDDEIDIKYEGFGNDLNSTSDAEVDYDLEIDDWKLNQNVECKVRLERMSEKEFQRLSEHVRATHVGGEVRQSPHPLPNDLLDLDQPSVVELISDKDEYVRRMESYEESVSNPESDSDADFSMESGSQSDPDFGDSISASLTTRVQRLQVGKINTRQQRARAVNTSKIKKKQFSCGTCGKICMSQDWLRLHERTHADPKTHRAKTKRKKLHTLKSVSSTPAFKFQSCKICGMNFFSKYKLRLHNSTVHTNEKGLRCETRGKSFQNTHMLRRHELIHTRERPFKCDGCEKSFKRLDGLTDHMKGHTGERPFKCNWCEKSFSRLVTLTDHMRSHTGERPFKCDVCEKTFKLSVTLSQHKKVHTSERPFQCDECEKSFKIRKALTEHKGLHTGTKPYKCEECGLCFSKSNTLIVHSRIHSGEGPYTCEVCGRGHKSSGHLRVHSRTHTGDRPYKCGTCDKAYMTKTHLTQHMSSHSEISHKCDVCEKSFKRRDNLAQHKKIHSGEKAYKCDVCDRRFMRSRGLTRHNLRHQKVKK